jgi:transposase-like protein
LREETAAIRLASWKQVFKERAESGLTIDEFCKKIGVSRNAYFYWQKKARAEVLASPEASRFVELMLPTEKPITNALISKEEKKTVLSVSIGKAKVEVPEGTSKDLLSMVMEVLANAE